MRINALPFAQVAAGFQFVQWDMPVTVRRFVGVSPKVTTVRDV